MFPCIRCTKQTDDDDREERDEGARQRGTLQRQDSVKSITTQLKDMVLKFSGSHKQSRSGPGSSSRGRRPMQFPQITMSEGDQYPYMGGVGSGSAPPPWDLRGSLQTLSGRSDQTMVLVAADQNPSGGHEPVAAAASDVVVEEADEGEMWLSHAEPGIVICFKTLPDGGNDLIRLHFCQDIFTRLETQQWWYDNYDRIIELYNVKKIIHEDVLPRVEDEQPGDISFPIQSSVTDSPVAAWLNNHVAPRHVYQPPVPAITFDQGPLQHMNQHHHHAGSSTTTARGEAAYSNMDHVLVSEWIQEDRDGVYLTIAATPDGTREIRRLKFNDQRFDYESARRWWEENSGRIKAQYL